MVGNVPIKKAEPHLCSNKVKIVVCITFLTVGMIIDSYFYMSFNGDSQLANYLRIIRFRKFNASGGFNNSIHKTNSPNIAKKFHLSNTSHAYITGPDKKKDKIILYWNAFFEPGKWHYGLGRKPFVNCEHKNCFTTNDKNKLLESNAMLCHMWTGGCGIKELPKARTPNQYWIYFVLESQWNSLNGHNLKPFNRIFNLTMTFKLDSNIILSYNKTDKAIEKIHNKKHHFYKGKTATVAWTVTNCRWSSAINGRMRYFAVLEKYIQVFRYGRCKGHTACGKNCFVELAKKHKFYFASENSLCKDYITEKPWNALFVGMIPIVYGLGDYSKALPPHSYIDVRDFKHPRLLADYLKEVASNETLYNSYFKWREEYKHLTTSSSSDYMCRLCAFLNKPDPPKSIIHNLDKFWSAKMDCVHPHSFNERVMQNK